jgi:hypothetical protein
MYSRSTSAESSLGIETWYVRASFAGVLTRGDVCRKPQVVQYCARAG